MRTSVFLDHLPDVSSVSSRKSTAYRRTSHRALLDLLLDEAVQWRDRDCPACGQPANASKVFSQMLMPFHQCSECNTIFATHVPDQQVLDRARLMHAVKQGEVGSQVDEFKFISLLNWINLTEARSGRKMTKVLDYRFCSQAPGWQQSAERLGLHRQWIYLHLSDDPVSASHGDLAAALKTEAPGAVMVLSEMDRVADPGLLLRCIKDNAPAGTTVFIATSCADGLEYEILGADSPSFIPLDRLTVFSIRGMEKLARDAGFEVLEASTPGRQDAVILAQYFKNATTTNIPFWSGFFRDADNDRLHDLQILLQRSLKSGVMRFALVT